MMCKLQNLTGVTRGVSNIGTMYMPHLLKSFENFIMSHMFTQNMLSCKFLDFSEHFYVLLELFCGNLEIGGQIILQNN